jgi:serine-type D-Ala-D-Ala carboxypeptidase (penicillin-binding protein 5/6)
MLPSGNDASLVLAENFGRLLIGDSCKTSIQSLRDFCEKDPTDSDFSRMCISRFVKRMNYENSKLKLSHSNYSNPHGLSDKANKSSAQDMVRLSFNALKFPLFVEIVSKFQYESKAVYDFDRKRLHRGMLVHQRWYNLNILLKD